ncbi:hypothetical protein M0813_11121 [Anaeramoeba flamelloides]|uniref:Reverse transcriptase n=1 Tax=Anaeramoeba flamelloides TaxID=1746091 RepID=A0ABQ8ZG74_9EUKA|nr:hypothetical protein M0813_11121 [Anaeramoeba flamelloides]
MIYQVIVQFGLKPNKSKTIETKDPKKIIYLGIWLNPKKHLNSNKEKAQKTYQKSKYILLHKGFSRGLRIQLFKSFVLSQIDYGLEIFEYSKSQMTTLNTWINKKIKKIKKILDVPIATPTEILQIECNIKDMNVNFYKRKVKLMEKLTTLNLDELKTEIQFQKYEFNTIDWANISSNHTNYFIIQEIKNKIEKTNKKIVKIYKNIINKQKINFKAQKYLNWYQSSTIFKFRSHMTCLNRDRYVYGQATNKEYSKACPCCNFPCEDSSHFLWNCPIYKEVRDSWIESAKEIKSHQLNVIIKNKDTCGLLAKVYNKAIYDSIIQYINKLYAIRTNWTSSPLKH